MREEEESRLSTDLEELHNVLLDLKKIYLRQTSLLWNFWRGILYGFGFVIGSAILTTFLVVVLTHLGIRDDSAIGRLIDNIVSSLSKSR